MTPTRDGTWTESVLHSFNGADGYLPLDGLIFDKAGNLYGTTNSGGSADSGAVFKLTPKQDGTWTESVLYSFTGSKDGGNPWAGLIFDARGNLYGTTISGGKPNCNGYSSGCGVVFKLTPHPNGTWNETVLHNFADNPGIGPWDGLVFDAAGHLYGTTTGDGKRSFGTVFEVTP